MMARFARFARARSGLAALEFALLAPAMITLLFGSLETIDALGANRRTQNAAASLADVVARDNSVTEDEIQGLWAGLDILMFPDDGATMDAAISSVSIDEDLEQEVVWSRGFNGYEEDAPEVVVPENLRRANTSVIVAQVRYRYNSPIAFLIDDLGFDMTHTVYRRSRVVDPIPCEWDGCS